MSSPREVLGEATAPNETIAIAISNMVVGIQYLRVIIPGLDCTGEICERWPTIVASVGISDNGRSRGNGGDELVRRLIVYQSKDVYRSKKGQQVQETPANEGWLDVGGMDSLAKSGAMEVIVQGQVIAVFLAEGKLYALDGMCAHQGGPIAQGQVQAGCVTCPWHGWQYELASGIQTINHQPLQKTFPVRQHGDRIEIRILD